MMSAKYLGSFLSLCVLAALTVAAYFYLPLPVAADTVAQPIPFSQDRSNAGLITAANDWSGVCRASSGIAAAI